MIGQPLKQIRKFIKNFDLNVFSKQAKSIHSADIAAMLTPLDGQNRLLAFHKLSPDKAVSVFEYFDTELQHELLTALSDEEKANILNKMSPDDRTILFSELPGLEVTGLVSLLSADQRKEAHDLLGYPQNSVGRLMNTHFISLSPAMTIAGANDLIMKKGIDSESINVVYISDDNGKLIDDMPLRRLFLHERSKLIRDIMDYSFVALNVNDLAENAIDIFKQYDRVALPVVNNDGKILGVVTVDDVLDVAEKKGHGRDSKVRWFGRAGFPVCKNTFLFPGKKAGRLAYHPFFR